MFRDRGRMSRDKRKEAGTSMDLRARVKSILQRHRTEKRFLVEKIRIFRMLRDSVSRVDQVSNPRASDEYLE